MSSFLFRLGGAALLTVAAITAPAQEPPFPNKAIRIQVGFAPGGGVDLNARLVAQKLSEILGQPVIVENRLGAAGMIAAELVAKSKPDGYTLLHTPSSVMTLNPVLYKQARYSAVRDFAPVSTSATYPLFLVVNGAAPVNSVKELVSYIKANPQKANYGGASGLFQLALELFKMRTGTHVEFIPYKGTADAAQAVMAGNVLMAMVSPESVVAMLKGGQVRALALTSPARLPAYAEIPTMAEAGFPDLEIMGWQAFLAPAGTPPAVVRMLSEGINRSLKYPDVMQKVSAQHITPLGSTPDELARKISSDLERWTNVAKAANIQPR